MTDLDVPDLEGVPYEHRSAIIAQKNEVGKVRAEIDGIVGLDSSEWNPKNPGQFSKEDLAELLLALGGPQ